MNIVNTGWLTLYYHAKKALSKPGVGYLKEMEGYSSGRVRPNKPLFNKTEKLFSVMAVLSFIHLQPIFFWIAGETNSIPP